MIGFMQEENLPKTQLEAIRYFGDLEKCHEFIVNMRWANGVKCPHCKSKRVGKFSGKRHVANCKDCKRQFTAKLGTIFEDSPLGLDKWLPAVWMIVNAKNGISSCELARSLGVTQKTAWHMGHRVRVALHQGSFEKLSGVVEADETFIGGLSRNMHKQKRENKITGTGGANKTAIQGLLERHSKGKSKVIAKVIPHRRKTIIHANVKQYVEKGSALMTDALPSYNDLNKDYNHQVIDHAEAYVNGAIHTNGLENFWCLLKRSIRGTYVSVAPFHLFRYLDEQAYRFNQREGTDGERFQKAVASLTGKMLPYAKLTGAV
ncbi:MAG: IS1595 family transposase [bacterium]